MANNAGYADLCLSAWHGGRGPPDLVCGTLNTLAARNRLRDGDSDEVCPPPHAVVPFNLCLVLRTVLQESAISMGSLDASAQVSVGTSTDRKQLAIPMSVVETPDQHHDQRTKIALSHLPPPLPSAAQSFVAAFPPPTPAAVTSASLPITSPSQL